MAICKDKTINYLNEYGYNVVRLPRTNIKALDILGHAHGKTENLGDIRKVWRSAFELPKIDEGETVKINGQKSSRLKVSIGLKILGDLLSGFGQVAPSLSGAYEKAASIEFAFANIRSQGYAPLDIGNFLAKGDLHEANDLVKKYFFDEDRQALIISEVLRTREITVIAYDKHDTVIKVEADVANGMATANVGVDSSSESKRSLTYTGNEEVTFAFKCLNVKVEDGSWKVDIPKKAYYLSPEQANTDPDPGIIMLNKGGFASVIEAL